MALSVSYVIAYFENGACYTYKGRVTQLGMTYPTFSNVLSEAIRFSTFAAANDIIDGMQNTVTNNTLYVCRLVEEVEEE